MGEWSRQCKSGRNGKSGGKGILSNCENHIQRPWGGK